MMYPRRALIASLLLAVPRLLPAQDSAPLRLQVRTLTRAMEAGADDGLPVTPATVSLAEATRARLSYRAADAERAYRALLQQDGAMPAHASFGLATLFAQSARYGDAVAWFDSSARHFAAIGDTTGIAEAWLGQGQALLRTRGSDASRAMLTRVQAIAPKDDEWIRGNVACTLLFIRIRAGQPVTNAELVKNRLLGRAASVRAETTCLLAQVEMYEGRGDVTQALAMLDTLAGLQTRARLNNSLSATRQWQGWIMVTQGDYVHARTALDEAVRLGVQAGTLTSAGWANSALAEIARRVGSWSDGARYALRAEQAFTAAEDGAGLASARVQSANVALATGDLARAAHMFADEQAAVLALFPRTAAEVLAARSDIARQAGDFAGARVLLDSADLFVRRFDVKGYANDMEYRRAMMALESHRLPEARRMFASLLARPSLTSPLLRYQALARLAEVDARDGNTASARAALERALAELDRWRTQLQDRQLRLAAAQTRGFDWDPDLGIATVIAAMATRGESEAALALSDARRARVLLEESLRRQMLVGDVPQVARAGTAAAAASAMPKDVAVVSYTTGAGGEPTTIIVVTAAGTTAKVTVPVDSISDVIRRFVAFMDAGHLARQVARRLASVLIDPVLPLLPPSVKRLVIVPDGSLHRLPFAALVLPGDSLLSQRFELVTSPSVEIALHGLARREGGAGVRRNGVLAFGAPAVDVALAGSWPPLPGASSEMRRIESIAAGTDVIEGDAATLASLRSAASRGGPVLHFATHARAMEHSLMSGAMLFAPENGRLREATAPEIAAMSLPFDLVVLSACESGSGSLLSGEGLQGIATAFLEAGARGVLATRWRMADRGSEKFLDVFYESLVRGRDAAGALADARRNAIDAGESPAVWANFELIGDPGVAPQLSAAPLWRRGWPVFVALLCLGGVFYGVRVFVMRMAL
ncbi:MAG: CHAT domain-containing protein [Gemmatimonadaceae bacterium]